MFEEYVEELSKSILFSDIDKEDLISMLHCLQPKICSYNKNNYIIIAGEKCESVGIILEGKAIVYKDNAAGNRVIMTLLKPGDMFGEMVIFSSKFQWPATIQAQESCKVFFLARGKIVGECEKMCPWHRMLIQNMLKIISERALMLNKKVEYLSIKSMRGKISAYLLEQYKKTGNSTFTLPLKRNELAEFLNVSRPSMSREMCRMRDEGIIDFHLATVRIIDVEALKDMLNS